MLQHLLAPLFSSYLLSPKLPMTTLYIYTHPNSMTHSDSSSNSMTQSDSSSDSMTHYDSFLYV